MKRLLSLILALTLLVSCFSCELTGYAAKMYAEDKIEEIQKLSGFVPGRTSIVTGNCYAFVSAVCEKLFGTKYQEELYNGYQCRHRTGKFYEVALLKTTTDTSTASIDRIINFFKQYAMPGDVVHYGALNNSSSTHTFMIQSIDNTKMRIFHSNYATRNDASTTCHIDAIYWDSFRQNPTQSVYNSNGTLYSHNSLFYNKMRYAGMGVTINRYTDYNKLYYSVGAASSVPPVLSATRTSPTSIKLSWNNVMGATKYCLAYKLSDASDYTTVSDKLTINYHEVTNLKVGKYYDFKVRAFALGEWMEYSNVVRIQALPPKPASVKVKPADMGLRITWPKKSGLSGVRVYRNTSASGNFILIATLGKDASSYVDTGVRYGEKFYYKIERFVHSDGKEYTNISNAYSGTYVLAKPKVTIDRLSSKTVKVIPKGDDCQSSFVYYVTQNGKTVQSRKHTKEKTFEINSLKVGKKYTVYVAEKTTLGQGEYGKLKFTALPKSVTNINATQVPTGIKITYDTQREAKGYRILRSTSPKKGYTEIATVKKGVKSYIDKKVKINKVYYYRVQSYMTANKKRYYSKNKGSSGAVKYHIARPKGVKVQRASATTMTVSWKAVSAAKSYTLSYKEAGGKWKYIKNIKKLTYTVKKLETGKKYYFRVRGVNRFGNGKFSKKIKRQMLPPAPKAPVTSVNTDGILITYTPAKYASKYLIYRADAKDGKYALLATVEGNKTNSYLDKSAVKGNTYLYKLVCCKVKNKKLYKSAMSEPAKQIY